MEFIIVPNTVKDAIMAAITEKAKTQPEIERYRDDIYRDLLAYYSEHGEIPEFDFELTSDTE